MSAPRPYGPNTDAVRRLLQRLAAAPADAWERASARYEALAATPRFATAERSLAAAVTASGRERERDAVVGPIVQIAVDAADRVAGRRGASEVDAASTDRFAEPALAAALAVVTRDVIGREAFEALYEAVGELVALQEIGG